MVLCHPGDASAQWAAEGLEARGCAPLQVVSSDDLLGAQRWAHRLSAGRPSTELELTSGLRLDDTHIAGVLNRLTVIPPAVYAAAPAEDREYAAQEMQALLLSVLHGLAAPVVNRPSPLGLCGAWRHPLQWAMLAARAGLPAVHVHASSDGSAPQRPSPGDASTAVVAGDAVLGLPDGAQHLAAGCRRLAALAGTALLGVELLTVDGTWRVGSATPLPDLIAAGAPVLDALAALLGRPVGATA